MVSENMKKYQSVLIISVALIFFLFFTRYVKRNYKQVEKEIIEIEKSLLDEWGKGHTMIFPDNSADEITYFDPSLEKRINGKTEFIKLLKPIENKFGIERYEMLDPKVQVHCNVAVLTYNLTDYSRNQQGNEESFMWNSTEVYFKIKGEWKIIHSHWSFVKPQVK